MGVTVTTIFETAWALRGYERILTDFARTRSWPTRMLDIPYRYHLAAAKGLVVMGVDMIWIGTTSEPDCHAHLPDRGGASQAANG